MSAAVQLPAIHTNGTGAKTLFDGYMAAREKLADAITANEARDVRVEMARKLADVQEYYMAHLMHIQDTAKEGAL